jgi:hypothetical protein
VNLYVSVSGCVDACGCVGGCEAQDPGGGTEREGRGGERGKRRRRRDGLLVRHFKVSPLCLHCRR